LLILKVRVLFTTLLDLFLVTQSFFIYHYEERIQARERNFFLEFAKSKNFSALNADHWYTVTREEILAAVSLLFQTTLITLIISFRVEVLF
jgi:hypothetical protein